MSKRDDVEYPALRLDASDWLEPYDRLHDGYTALVGLNTVTITDLYHDGPTWLQMDKQHAIEDAREWC